MVLSSAGISTVLSSVLHVYGAVGVFLHVHRLLVDAGVIKVADVIVVGRQLRRDIQRGYRRQRHFFRVFLVAKLFVHACGKLCSSTRDFVVQRLRRRKLVFVVLFQNLVVHFMADRVIARDQVSRRWSQPEQLRGLFA